MGIPARSWQGWQIPILTDDAHGSARITGIDGARLIEGFGAAKSPWSRASRACTRRPAASPRSGAAARTPAPWRSRPAIGADRCDIYTDVDGVYTTDPRIVSKARRLDRVAFEEMLEMASLGAKVLQVRSVELAMVHNVRTFVRSSFDDPANPQAAEPSSATRRRSWNSRSSPASPIPRTRPRSRSAGRGQARRRRGDLRAAGRANINVDMIIQVVVRRHTTTDITFTVPTADFERARSHPGRRARQIGFAALQGATDLVKVSAIGIGMRSHAGVAAKAFKALAEKGINIRAITTSEIKFSVLIDAAYTELAVRTLHSLYGLDKA